jgi:hypothetical protein
MKITFGFRCAVIALLLVLGGAVLVGTPAQAQLKAGAASVDMTPEKPCFLGGYFFLTDRSKGVHDPLFVRALVLDNGQARVAFITMDIVIMNGVMAGEIKDLVNRETGIPVDHINISAIHTHTGPEGYFEEFGKYPKEYDPDMKMTMERQALQAVQTAIGRMQPASFGYVQFTLEHQNGNRHDPDGPVDRTAIVGVLKDAAGKPFAGFLNFAAHPTVAPAGDYLVSAEWPGMFAALMEKKLGGDTAFLYLQGASGNLGTGAPGEKVVDGQTIQLDDWQKAEYKAELLADAVFPKLSEIDASPDIVLSGARRDYEFRVRSRTYFRKFEQSLPELIKAIQDDPALSDTLKERRISWINDRYGTEKFMSMIIPTMKRVKEGKTKTSVQAMRIGGLVFLAFPGEAITELSIQLRKDLAPMTVAVLGYSNDHLGYITNREIFKEGGYEAGMGLCFPDATEEMVSGLMEMAASLFSE